MSNTFRVIGVLAWAIGAWLLFVGLRMGVTVNLDGQGEVANLQLMHAQQLNVLLGALAVIEGTICVIAGELLGRISTRAGKRMDD